MGHPFSPSHPCGIYQHTYFIFTCGGTERATITLSVLRPDNSKSTISQCLVNCLANQCICFLRKYRRCPFDQRTILSDLPILLSIPSLQHDPERFTYLLVAPFCGVVVVLGSPCFKEPSSVRTKSKRKRAIWKPNTLMCISHLSQISNDNVGVIQKRVGSSAVHNLSG